MNRNIHGFTLIELMITIVIASILITIAAPNFQKLVQNNRTITMTNQFITSLMLARSEAIKRGTSVSMCASSNTTQTTCATTAENANSWRNGWFVFSDTNGDGIYDSATDTQIKIQANMRNGLAMPSSPAYGITYQSSGFLSRGAGNYQIFPDDCDTGTIQGRQVNISITGRPSVDKLTCS